MATSKGPAPKRSGAPGKSSSVLSSGRSAPQPAAKPSGPAKTVRRVGSYKANLLTRIGAGAIDTLTGFVPALVFFLIGLPWIGVLVWLAYLLVKDGLPIPQLEYRSVGKRITGLHVEDEKTSVERISLPVSIKRNLPAFGGFLLLAVLWSFSLPAGIALAVIPAVVEIVMMARDENGVRIGDRLGSTRVLD